MFYCVCVGFKLDMKLFQMHTHTYTHTLFLSVSLSHSLTHLLLLSLLQFSTSSILQEMVYIRWLIQTHERFRWLILQWILICLCAAPCGPDQQEFC